jgi:hypothetical protein
MGSPLIPLPIIGALVAGAVGFGAAWQWQANCYGSQIAELKTEYATQQAKAVEKAHAETIRLQEKTESAAKQHAARASKMAHDIDGAKSVADRLRLELAALLMSENPRTASDYETINRLLAECSGRYGDMAAEADKRSSEVILLLESWPK